MNNHSKEYYCEHWKKMKFFSLIKLEIFGGLFYFRTNLQFQCQLIVIMVENFYTRSFRWRICRTKRMWEHHNLFASLLLKVWRNSQLLLKIYSFAPSNCRTKDSCNKSCIIFGWVFIDDKALQMKR